jgi:peptidoglycan/xylan/chitin deacetylase (PgdA/CDA1 family)
MQSILLYRSIKSSPQPMACDIDISPERFERQLHWLSRWHRVVRVEETLGTSGNSRSGKVAITFDGGFRDNLIVALPLLEKYHLPVTLFVATGLIGRRDHLSADELREMARHPLVTIGSQGLGRGSLTDMSNDEARLELRESRSRLKAISGRRIEFMAWPDGECDARLERLSAECGYLAAWSIWKGNNSTYSRWRVPLGRRDNMARFIAKVSGGYNPAKLLEQKWNRVHKVARPLDCVVAPAY